MLGIFVAVHVLRYLLPDEQSAWLTAALAFVPARLTGMARDLPGGDVATYTQFVTHLFVHGDLTHLLINSAWLLAFGSPVARRTGTVRFLCFFLLCGIAGALFYAAVEQQFAQHDGRGVGRHLRVNGGRIPLLVPGAERWRSGRSGETRCDMPPLMSLRAAATDRRVLLAIAGLDGAEHSLCLGRRRPRRRRQHCLGGASRRLLHGLPDLRPVRPT